MNCERRHNLGFSCSQRSMRDVPRMLDPASLSLVLGTHVAKWAFRIWTKDSGFEALGDDIITTIGKRLGRDRPARSLARQFEELAEDVADRLAPFLSVEAAGVDEGEILAACHACERTLQRGHAVEASSVLSSDLTASQLLTYVKQQDPYAVSSAGLSDAGIAIYDTVLVECVSFITSVAHKLPGYVTLRDGEILRRTTNIYVLAERILDELPQSSVPKEWGVGSEDQRFENTYRRVISEYSENLQLYGVTATSARNPYPLSVAYISLSIETESIVPALEDSATDLDQIALSAKKPRGASGKYRSSESKDSVRIESLLDDSDYILLTGGAGSGKTTLLQWLALTALSNSAAEGAEGHNSWADRVPFVIPLRRYSGGALPRPEEFLVAVAPNLVGAMPSSWAHRVLASGRAMLLVDGLDEIPLDQREDARLWLLQLISTFPNNKVIVTSRSTAITREWEGLTSFSKATLLPMALGDIKAFVSHWHAAARSISASDEHSDKLDSLESSMLTLIRDRQVLRSLSTTPLLCALICALHSESGASLPTNRMELYKTALEMLIARRDNDRRINTETDVDLSYDEREVLLRAFALWMHDNGASDAGREDYIRKISQQIAGLHRVASDGETLGQFLLERSGVLREPVPGRVDFVHRTFLEYLAAAALVDDNSIDKLVGHGHQDHWREVIIMAAGHSIASQREALLGGLLTRGENDLVHRHRLYLLAVACMETAPKLSPGLQIRLEQALSSVLPPRNMTEAAAVASAGPLAIERLVDTEVNADVAAASVRALSLIGGDEALRSVQKFRHDHRLTVTRQLIRAWSYFDVEQYARDVLSDCSLERGFIAVSDVEQMRHLHLLTKADNIYLDVAGRLSSWQGAPEDDRVFGLNVSHVSWLKNFGDAPILENLDMLIAGSSGLTSLYGISRYSKVTYLDLSNSRRLVDISELANLTSLEQVVLSRTAIENFNFLHERHHLSGLNASWLENLQSLGDCLPVTSLQLGYAERLHDTDVLEQAHQLRDLSVMQVSESVSRLVLADQLETLSTSFDLLDRLDVQGGAGVTEIRLRMGGLRRGWTPRIGRRLSKFPLLNSLYIGEVEGDAQAIVEQLEAMTTAQTIVLHGRNHADVEVEGMHAETSLWSTTFTRVDAS
jgi:energy-coupling factor transporter ATP-binding protein EcfA2